MTDSTQSRKPRPPNAGKGRRKGVPNKFTVGAKAIVELCFDDIGGREAFAAWARKHRTEFYKVFARLIPVDVRAQVEHVTRLSYAEERAREAAGETPGLAPPSTVQ
jgi:hypothetical protein